MEDKKIREENEILRQQIKVRDIAIRELVEDWVGTNYFEKTGEAREEQIKLKLDKIIKWAERKAGKK